MWIRERSVCEEWNGDMCRDRVRDECSKDKESEYVVKVDGGVCVTVQGWVCMQETVYNTLLASGRRRVG